MAGKKHNKKKQKPQPQKQKHAQQQLSTPPTTPTPNKNKQNGIEIQQQQQQQLITTIPFANEWIERDSERSMYPSYMSWYDLNIVSEFTPIKTTPSSSTSTVLLSLTKTDALPAIPKEEDIDNELNAKMDKEFEEKFVNVVGKLGLISKTRPKKQKGGKKNIVIVENKHVDIDTITNTESSATMAVEQELDQEERGKMTTALSNNDDDSEYVVMKMGNEEAVCEHVPHRRKSVWSRCRQWVKSLFV